MIFHHFAERNTARLNAPIFPIGEDQRFDWQIFEGLRERLTGKKGSDPSARLALPKSSPSASRAIGVSKNSQLPFKKALKPWGCKAILSSSKLWVTRHKKLSKN